MAIPRMTEEQFWASMKRDPDTGCLLWTGATSKGYGKLRFNGKDERAHRVAWKLMRGEISHGYDVHHLPTCPKTCCEIEHLDILPHSEHMRLTHKLGQINYSFEHASGDNNACAKITDDQAKSIFTLREQGWKQVQIANSLGISQSLVSAILRGETRRYLSTE